MATDPSGNGRPPGLSLMASLRTNLNRIRNNLSSPPPPSRRYDIDNGNAIRNHPQIPLPAPTSELQIDTGRNNDVTTIVPLSSSSDNLSSSITNTEHPSTSMALVPSNGVIEETANPQIYLNYTSSVVSPLQNVSTPTNEIQNLDRSITPRSDFMRVNPTY